MVRIAAAIESFVMHDHSIFHMLIQILITYGGITDYRMSLDNFEFFIRQFAGLP